MALKSRCYRLSKMSMVLPVKEGYYGESKQQKPEKSWGRMTATQLFLYDIMCNLEIIDHWVYAMV